MDGKGGVLALALKLKRSSSADRGVESDVTRLAVGRSGLDVAPSLAISAGEAALAGLAAGQLIEGRLQPLRTEISANGYRASRYLVVIVGGFLALILRR